MGKSMDTVGMVRSNALPSVELHQPSQTGSILGGGIGEGDENLYILGEIQRMEHCQNTLPRATEV